MICRAVQLQSVWLALAVMLLWFQPATVQAQAKLNEGEEVHVLFLNTWHEGVVIGRDRSKWVVEFVFANSPKRDQFERPHIRKLCEFTAMDYARTWSSTNGKVSVVAAMKGVSNDEVLLIKEDLEEIQVPLASLSQEDVNYVNKMQRQYEQAVMRREAPAITPNLPDVEDSGSGGFGTMASFVLNSD